MKCYIFRPHRLHATLSLLFVYDSARSCKHCLYQCVPQPVLESSGPSLLADNTAARIAKWVLTQRKNAVKRTRVRILSIPRGCMRMLRARCSRSRVVASTKGATYCH
jgi:hypothetical protein